MNNRVTLIVASALFTTLTVIGAYIRIPLPYVPLSMQTFFVLLAGYFLGYFYGSLSQILYVLLGLAGMPVFAEGGGLAYVFKPTFGYLLGFPLAAFVVGLTVHGRKKFLYPQESGMRLAQVRARSIYLAGILGMLCIFIPGVLYLYAISHFVLRIPVEFSKIVFTGFLVFIPGDILKITAIFFLLRAFSARYALSEN